MSYYVFNTRGKAPTFAHSTYEEALSEAKRLANLHKGEVFRVLGEMDEIVSPYKYSKEGSLKDGVPKRHGFLWETDEKAELAFDIDAVIKEHAFKLKRAPAGIAYQIVKYLRQEGVTI